MKEDDPVSTYSHHLLPRHLSASFIKSKIRSSKNPTRLSIVQAVPQITRPDTPDIILFQDLDFICLDVQPFKHQVIGVVPRLEEDPVSHMT